MTEPADLNVDELRRRARRRLVGAIVLALAAAVIVPMLLESEPRPLGEDVSVKIPPVDDGKFVNRLNTSADSAQKSDKGAKASDSTAAGNVATSSAPEPTKPTTPNPPPSDSTSIAKSPAPSPSGEGAATPKPGSGDTNAKDADGSGDAGSAGKPDEKSVPPHASDASTPAVQASGSIATGVAARGDPAKVAMAAPQASTAKSMDAAEKAREGFSVQLAAFADDKGANALAGKLKRAGYAAYTEPLKTSKGTLWRVRVGPYPTREAANGVRDKLKAQGQDGIVAPAR